MYKIPQSEIYVQRNAFDFIKQNSSGRDSPLGKIT